MSESSNEKIKVSYKPQIIEDTKTITNQMVDKVKVTLNDLIADSVSKVNELNIQRFEEKQAELESEYQMKINEAIREYDVKKNELNQKIALKEEAILADAKAQAELILQNAFDESAEMYETVQNEITDLKGQLALYQQEVEKEKAHQDKELANRLDELNKIYQAKQRELEDSLTEREHELLHDARVEANQTLNEAEQQSHQIVATALDEAQELKAGTAHELLSEKAEHQAKLSDDFLRLNREKEWFSLYQEQVEQRYVEKERALYQKRQAEIDELELKVHELQNQTEFYQDMDQERKDKAFLVGLYICLIAGVNVVLMTLFKQSSVLFPIFSAFFGAYLIYTSLTNGRFERSTKKLMQKNEWLIEKNDQLKKQMEEASKKLEETTAEKNRLASEEQRQNALLKDVQKLQETIHQQVTERRLVESENLVLRKRLMDHVKHKED